MISSGIKSHTSREDKGRKGVYSHKEFGEICQRNEWEEEML
jgi:hypothetical protein